MAKTLTKYLFIAVVLSLGFGQLLRLEWGGIPFYPHDILIALIILLHARVLLSAGTTELSNVPLSVRLILAGLLIGWGRGLTLYPVASLTVPFLYSIRICAYLVLYYLARGHYRIPARAFTTSGLIALGIGLTQYFVMPDMRWAQYLGWDDHLNRLVLPHYDPTFTGIMLSLFLFYLVPLETLTSGIVVCGLAVGILLTYARSIWVSLSLTLLYAVKSRLLLIGVLVVGICGILLLPRRFGEGNNLSRTFSIESRLQTDFGILQSLKYDVITGRGYNIFATESISSKGFPNHAKGTNNSYLHILATMGIGGLVGWVLFYRDIYRTSHQKNAILFLMIAALFNNALLYPFAFLWIILADVTEEKIKVRSGV